MELPSPPDLHPAFLPPGTLVGPWRVVSRRGRGSYGVVYRAERAGEEHSGLVALKIAVYEQEPRFKREVELLSRIHHPSVPRPKDHGEWRSPSGRIYPYIAMEWVEGTPLYEWAATHNPSSRRALEMLAQLARALDATERAEGVHRDVKGDNMLVREGDGRTLLTDFGSGNYEGAPVLTWRPLPPGTPAYRSPEAWQFLLRNSHHPGTHYCAGLADDLFSLGVTAYRLVTDEYPPPTDPGEDIEGVWQVDGAGARPPASLNPRVAPQLDALILRMLSVRPEARGTVQALAEALEQAARSAGPEADQPLFAWETAEHGPWPAEDSNPASMRGHRPRRRERAAVLAAERREAAGKARAARQGPQERSQALAPPESAGSSEQQLRWVPWLVAGLVLTLSMWWERNGPPPPPTIVQAAPDAGTMDDWVNLADGSELVLVSVMDPETHLPIAGRKMPKTPLPGQRRPPCSRGEVEIRSGCWVLTPQCPDYTYAWQGSCYMPVMPPPRPVTSSDQYGVE
ncbi:MAG: serine/threonine protein kinase [Myxococcaceae bacterium]|nr:serine/threonine protein kinase [Myxococcaceae bacterium]